ncbi:outer membrane beta-barrel family protein [Ancylomarina longa]|uniref:TonB-dependent receptor n=1 Tax=Ancylomarina longa TaxID=2487017 RepID=A0A434AVM2_9BACT|nr:outer membrane beta-barrel family protein [Ancylomarina longa]RUT78508.1 TonB-dependent receptor [Ancylomarina longa]
MQRVLVLIILMTICSITTQAEENSHAIKGKLINEDEWPIEFATIRVIQDSILLGGCVSDVNGDFLLNKIPEGAFDIVITHINYDEYDKKLIIEKSDLSLGSIVMKKRALHLEEISVKAEKKLYRRSKRNDVFQISSAMSDRSGDVRDLLDQIPTIQVSRDYNLSVEGEGNVLVLVDGRKYYSINGLRLISKDQIDRVEINNNPSVEYADNGYKAVVNIILKKNQEQSFNGNMNVILPNKNFKNVNLALNYYSGKFRVFGGYNLYNHKYNYDLESTRSNLSSNKSIQQIGKVKFNPNSTQNAFGGIDYFINERHQFSLATNFRFQDNDMASVIESFDSGSTIAFYSSDGTRRLDNQDWQVSAFYKYKLKSGKSSIVSDFLFSRFDQEEKLNFVDQYLDQNLTFRNDTSNVAKKAVKIDVKYECKLSKHSSLNMGVKYNGSHSDNKMQEGDFKHRVNFDLDRQIAYIDYSGNINKLDFWFGLAGELNQRKIADKDKEYWHFYPNIGMNYSLSSKTRIGASYQKSINQPDIYQLDPFVYTTDSLNLSQGNPDLDDYVSHWMDINYRYQFGRSYLKFTGYYNITKDGINLFTDISDTGVLTSSFENIGTEKETGLKLNYSIWLTKRVLIIGNFNAYYQQFESVGDSHDLLSTNTLLYTKFYLPADFSVMLGVSSKGKQIISDGTYTPYSNLRFGLAKKLFKRKVNLYLNWENPILPYQIKVNQKTDQYKSFQKRDFDTRVLMFSFAYNFQSKNKKKKKLRNQINWENNGKSLEF